MNNLSPRWQAYNLIDKYYSNNPIMADDLKNCIVNTPSFDRTRYTGQVILMAKRKVMYNKMRELHNIRKFEQKIGIK